MQRILTNITAVLELLNDEDIFLKHFEQLTAFRLINETSVSREAETLFLDKISGKYGIDQVSRLKRMFVDIDLSEVMLYRMLIWENSNVECIESEDEEQKTTDFIDTMIYADNSEVGFDRDRFKL